VVTGPITGAVTGRAIGADEFIQQFGAWEVLKDVDAFTNDISLTWDFDRGSATFGYYASSVSSNDLWALGNSEYQVVEQGGEIVTGIACNDPAVDSCGFNYDIDGRGDATTNALYAATTFDITDRLRADVGVRYEEYEVDYTLDEGRAGTIDFAATLSAIQRTGYDGWIGHELAPKADPVACLRSTYELVSLPDHKLVRTLVANTELATRVKQFVTPGEFFQVTLGDGTALDGWMIKPKNMVPGKRYPLRMYVYGEPAGATVQDSWGFEERLWFQAIADAGYLVASVDNQGTPAPKGRAWRKAVYGQIGVLSSAQQADAVKVMERTRPDIDPTRVAIWGWSGGGSSTLQAMFRYPDVYTLGMSVAPVPDQRFYDTIYQERFMGLPDSNAAAYKSASAINQAAGLEGHLLVIHGTGDDNVHYQGTELMLNKLIELNKQVDFMSYPNRTHCICEGNGTTLHIYSTLTRYLMEHMPPSGPQP